MKENSTNKSAYKFLTNQPLGEDLFENKSQDKIAEVISEKIINEPEFKIIGIDGEWGSGKSNLVKLVERKLEATHKFFVYDVWGHQEDEQRHAILSELTDFITKEKIVEGGGNWNEKLKTLTSKQRQTTSTNIPHLSIGFILSLLLIIYVPTVNTFAVGLNIWLKIVLILLPILVLFGLFIISYFRVRKKGKIKNHYNLKRWGRLKRYSIESAQHLFKIYHNEKVDETKIEIISENEPTVKEFRCWMKNIDNDLNHKVVIVFDNFDRLPKRHILSIWSSIHIFFAEEPYENIKVILPFDREHVQKAFRESKDTVDKKFGDDYVNKTFDIVFRITLPIMSNWKKFFKEQWKIAFANYDENEYKLVVQVYEFLHRRITPREIISFINEILTIKLLDENFKERYIAIFVLRKDEILKNPLKAVTDFKDILGGLSSLYGNDPDYAKQLTAIIYHIDVENAVELIYRQELKDSLIKNDVERFNEICNSDFIDSIFVSAIHEIEVFENPIITLASLKEDSKVSLQHINQTWVLFYNQVRQLDNKVSKLEIAKWQTTLIKNIPDNRYLTSLLDGYFKLFEAADDSDIEHYIDLIDDLINDLTENRVLNLLTKRNITAPKYLKLIEYKGKEHSKYKLSANYDALDVYLSELTVDDILALENTDFLPKNYDFKKYREALKNTLSTFVTQNNAQSANKALIKLKEISHKIGDLKDLLDDAKIHSFYLNNRKSDLPIINELIAMRIARAENFPSNFQSQFSSVLNTGDEDRAEKIGNVILQYITYGDLLLKSNYFKGQVLFKQIVLKMFAKSKIDDNIDLMVLVENYKDIKTSLDIDDNKLLIELDKWEIDKTKLDVNKLDDEFISDCIEDSQLRIAKDFFGVFNDEFKDLDKESYETVFEDGTDVHFRYFKHINPLNLTQTSLDVFESKFIEKLKTGHQIKDERWDILGIYDANNSSLSVVNSLKNIRDNILRSQITLNLGYVKGLLPYFIRYDLLTGHEDVFRLIIKNEFLLDSDFVNLLISNSDYIKQLYQNASQSDKKGFRNLLNEKRKDNSELENLAKVMRIPKSKDKSEEK